MARRTPKPLPGRSNDAKRTRQGARADSRNAGNGGNGGHGTAGASDGSTGSHGAGAGDSSGDERLQQLLEQFGNGGYRLLAERIDGAGAVEYLGAIPLTSELYEAVRQRWGGGLFGGRIVDERSKYRARFPSFRIAGAPRVPGDDTPAAAAHAQPSELATVLQSINANLAALSAAVRTPPTDPVDQVVKIAQALKATAGGAPAAPAAEPFSQMRDMLALMRELREDSAPEPAESTLGAVLRDGVGPLVQVLNRKIDVDAQREQRRAGSRVNTPAALQPPVTPQPAAVDQVASIPSDELAALLLTIPMAGRRFLLSCAEQNDEPADYTHMLLNRLSDDAYEAMVRHLPREDFLDVLIATVPGYAPYRDWFGRLVDELRAAVASDASAEEDEQPAAAGAVE